MPDGVLNFLTGGGSTVGNALVENPKTRLIAFTGSRDVGVQISEKAGRVVPGQIWIKRAILEMGGKDFILVDETADVEDAANGIVAAAFGFQGQKCSACSRLIVHQKVHDDLLARVVAKTEALSVGDVRDPKHNVGAVINASAHRKILEYVGIGKKEGRVVAGGKAGPKAGLLRDADGRGRRSSRRRAWRARRSSVPCSRSSRSGASTRGLPSPTRREYGLTGALYTRERERLLRGKRELFVGNLYLNRKCTGALVGVHPFGGFNMSGTDSKAGGRDYLNLFTQQKAISEKL